MKPIGSKQAWEIYYTLATLPDSGPRSSGHGDGATKHACHLALAIFEFEFGSRERALRVFHASNWAGEFIPLRGLEK